MPYEFLIHDDHDDVGVAVRDLQAGESVTGVYQKSFKDTEVTLRDIVPLGHKVALKDLNQGDQIIEYNEVIGRAVVPINKGDHVHIHNIKSVRWG